MKTPISVIAGFLGAGKTTLLRRIIDGIDKKLAIIMNEFGEIGIDTEIVRGKNIDVAELAGGCVCCSLTGEFEAAVNEIIEKFKPELIIVETTGVAEADALVFDIEESLQDVKLDTVITVIDADGMLRFPSLGMAGKSQIEIADVVLINKTDLADEAELNQIEDKIKELNNHAKIFKTDKCNADVDLLFGATVEKHIKLERQHETKMQSFSADVGELNKDKFIEFAENLPKNVYRAKGFVQFDSKTFLFSYVAGRYDFEELESGKLGIVFIGEDILKVKDEILAELKRCEKL